MSYSSPLKNLPDFFRRQSLEKTLETLRQPTSLSVLFSVGAHGLFFAALPWLTSPSQPLDTQRQVQVVELTPEERSRLPEFASPFPPENNFSSSATLPSTTKTPPASASKPPTPIGPNPLDDPSLYKFPIIPPPTINLPPIVQPPLIPIPGITAPPLTANSVPTPTTRPPQPTKTPATAATPSAVTPSPGATTPAPSSSPVASAPVPAPVRPEKLTQEQIVALQEQGRKALQEKEGFTFNLDNTTQEAFEKNSARLRDIAVNVSEGNIEKDWEKRKDITDLYPQEACPFKVEGLTWVGAIVRPDGKLAADPELLLSSGYKALDKVGLEYVTKQEFKSAEQYQAIIFPFKFKYSEAACPPEAEQPAS